MPLKLKDAHKETLVAFGKSGKPLGQRDDLHLIARLGKDRNKQLLQYFDEVPTDEELDQLEAEYFSKQQAKKKFNTESVVSDKLLSKKKAK